MNGEEMRAHRKLLRLTQAELAQRIGMSRVMIGMMEREACEISPRTRAAVLAASPRPLDRRPQQFNELVVRLENALIASRLTYTADKLIGGSEVDFYLEDLGVALYVETGRHAASHDRTSEVDTISIAGKSAVDAFTTLLQYGGVHALRHAGRDPYALNDVDLAK